MEKCFINLLDDDCLIKIFHWLPIPDRIRIERVCTKWKHLNPNCWEDIKDVNISTSIELSSSIVNTKLLTNEALTKLLKRLNLLISLTIYQSGLPIDSKVLPIISNCCPNLKKIKLYLEEYDSKHLNEFCSKMKSLEYIQLGHLDESFSTDSLINLSESVQHISLIGTTVGPFHNWSFRHISTSFLQTLSKLTNLSALKLYGFSLNLKRMKVICQIEGLKVLTLSSCVVKSGIDLISDLKNLQDLNLYKVPQVSEDFLLNLTANCPNLRKLNLNYYDGLTDNGMKLLVEKADNLEQLDLLFTGVKPSTLSEINKAVKSRKNGTQLEVIVAAESINDSECSESYSELLKVTPKPMMMYNDCIGPIRDYQDTDSDDESH